MTRTDGLSGDEAEMLAIADYNRNLLAAIAAGDLDAIGRLTYRNLVMMGDGRPASQGKDRAMAAYADAAGRFDVKETWEAQDTLVDGDIAFQRGRFFISLTTKATGEQSETSGSYHHVYRKLPRSGWTLAMVRFASEQGGEIWNEANG